MKKQIFFLCCILFSVLFLVSGCGKFSSQPATVQKELGVAENDIFTYKKVNPEKTQLVVAVTKLQPVTTLIDAFEKENPDIQIIPLDITGGTDAYRPVLEWMDFGYRPDILFSREDVLSSYSADVYAGYYEDLTSYGFLKKYNTEALLDKTLNGHVYYIPGPSYVMGLQYNQTLFNQYGWKLPQTFDEFADLCVQIEKDTNGKVRAFNPDAKYSREFSMALEAFVYPEILAGKENRTWLHDFESGKASFTGHMEPLYDSAKRLIDQGTITEDYFSYSATTRHKEFSEGKIAMVNLNLDEIPQNSDYTFGVMPFPGKEPGQGYILISASCWIGIPKKSRSEKTMEAIQRFMDFVSTKEGQTALINNSLLISNLKNADMPSEKVMEGISPAILTGRVFTHERFQLDGVSFAVYNTVDDIRQGLIDMQKGEKNEAEAIALVDENSKKALLNPEIKKQPAVASATSDFTILETSELFADMFREKTGADIALMMNNIAYRGNLMRIFKGDITPLKITALLPRSFDNKSVLLKAQMTGAQLLDALNRPVGGEGQIADCIYAFSGLKAEIYPWNSQGHRYNNITLSDGTSIDQAKTYSVAFWEGTVQKEDYSVLESYDGSFTDILTDYLSSKKKISPDIDNRVSLNWK